MTVPFSEPLVVVIVPFFQRERGVLAKALRSVIGQNFSKGVHTLIIDDASPISAEDEVVGIGLPPNFSLRILKQQKNGGPGAARNVGLNSLPDSCRYVAFLDSDDEWTPYHLSNAWVGLESGFDFYFSDHYQLGQSVGAFRRAGRIDVCSHPSVSVEHTKIREFKGDMVAQILNGNVIGTSTVVYRLETARNQRFREEYRRAGEDYIFWLEFSTRTSRFIFSEECEARYGRGVNVFSGVMWGTKEHLERISNEIRYLRYAITTFHLDYSLAERLGVKLAALRQEWFVSFFHVLRSFKSLPLREAVLHLRQDPDSLKQLSNAIVSVFNKKKRPN